VKETQEILRNNKRTAPVEPGEVFPVLPASGAVRLQFRLHTVVWFAVWI